MSKYTKIAAGTLAALTIAVGTLATSTTEAHAKKFWGGKGLGFGIAAGVIGAAAFAAATAPSYYGVAGCRYVERYDVFGNYLGTRKICRYY
jgi:hypothetical protein